MEESELRKQLADKAIKYEVGTYRTDPIYVEAMRQLDGSTKWRVTDGGNQCLWKDDLQFAYESMPSSRTDEILANTRFTLQDALVLARKAQEKAEKGAAAGVQKAVRKALGTRRAVTEVADAPKDFYDHAKPRTLRCVYVYVDEENVEKVSKLPLRFQGGDGYPVVIKGMPSGKALEPTGARS